MIWFTWRQFRTSTWTAVGALAAVGVVLVITGRTIADAYDAANVAACGSDCAAAIDNFLTRLQTTTAETVYYLITPTMYIAPALVGMFWGAPLLARELETGTHRLAWNQSITRTRWLATKLAVIGGATVATVGLLSWAVTSWASKWDEAAGSWIDQVPERGIVPIGYALFALTLGVTLGMLIRRTVPAMAATLAIYGGLIVAMGVWIRAHLVPADHITRPLDMSSFDSIMVNPDTNEMMVRGSANLPDAWVLSNQTITGTGDAFTGPVNWQACGEAATPETCTNWIGSLGLRQDLTYHPADHFWPLQWVETGILLGLSALLVGICFWWIRRRVS